MKSSSATVKMPEARHMRKRREHLRTLFIDVGACHCLAYLTDVVVAHVYEP